MGEKVVIEQGIITRHGSIELIEHWVLAISGMFLIFSGFGELPMYKRYMVTQIPGLGWAGDFLINLTIHYLSGIFFVSVMIFHALYHGWLGHQGLLPRKGDVKTSCITLLSMFGFGEEPKSDKYLPEQRMAYAYLGGMGLILVLTGIVKVVKNLPGIFLPPALITSMTLIHTFATIFFLLGVLAHLAALIFKVNRPLTQSVFTGKVDLKYIQDRHTVWYEKLMKNKVKVETEEKVGEVMREVEAEFKEEVKVEDQVKKEEDEKNGVVRQPTGIKSKRENDKMATVLRVKGMSCQHCVMSVTKALNQLEGVKNVQVDLAKGEVRFDNTKGVASNQIEKTITDAGYEVIHA